MTPKKLDKGLRFNIYINGFGDTDKKCWEDALRSLALFPPDMPDYDNIQEVCTNCGYPDNQCICSPDYYPDGSEIRRVKDTGELADKLYESKNDK